MFRTRQGACFKRGAGGGGSEHSRGRAPIEEMEGVPSTARGVFQLSTDGRVVALVLYKSHVHQVQHWSVTARLMPLRRVFLLFFVSPSSRAIIVGVDVKAVSAPRLDNAPGTHSA